ncbi:transposase [Sporomusa sp.]|uniref:transposase n=1 Tax=Sporomusa sp. TaxID=2078658 RepID=UPI002C9EA26D|nr:transposase [Sporomusa sp.]HWR45763.1 transposase [Sporomusa sp.]
MARKPRIHYEKAIYHVIARGNNKDNIFLDIEDKYKYLDLLDKYKQKYNFELYAYVLMDNHIHLLICVSEIPLAKIMQGVQQTYTLHFNRKYQHVGHVFQQRYKAFLCNNDSYLLTLVCYIHQNPCRANLPAKIGYTWSSHRDYMVGHGRVANPIFALHMWFCQRKS